MSSNVFGGKNKNFIYTPLSECEQEAIHRLFFEKKDVHIKIKDWGIVNTLDKVVLGDKSISLEFHVNLRTSGVVIPVYFLDLSLERLDGRVLFSQSYSVESNNQPLYVGSSPIEIGLVWDVGLSTLDEAFVREIKPGALGLTTREGNRHLTSEQKNLLNIVHEGEKRAREVRKKSLEIAKKKSLY